MRQAPIAHAMQLPDGAPLRRLASHGDACFGCGAQRAGGLRMTFTDDGSVTRARLTIGPEWALDDEVRASIVLAVMEEALYHAAHARLGADAMTDGKLEPFARGVKPGVPLVVEAWPGRRGGPGFWFYARVLQEDEERAHVETWMATKAEALARRKANDA